MQYNLDKTTLIPVEKTTFGE